MTAPHAVGLDVGTTHTKAVLVALDGDDAACVPLAVAVGRTPDDAPSLLARAAELVREVVDRTAVVPDVVGIASMAETGVPLDADGVPLTPLLRWDRQHGSDQVDALTRVHGRHALFAATGVRPSGKAPLAVWAWLRTQTDVVRRMRRWVGVADLLVLALTGSAVTDHTLAGRSMAYRLPRPGEAPPSAFDGDLLALAGMPEEAMSAVAAPTRPAGVVGGARAKPFVAAGLRPGTPVVVAGHDHAVGAWACGARHPGAAVDSLGTSEAVLTVARHVGDAAAVLDAGMALVTTASGAHRAVIAGAAGGAVLRAWISELGPPDQAGLLAAVADDVLAAGEPLVEAALPYPTGRQTPAPDPAARLVVPAGGDPVRATRAVLEGLALHARWMLEVQAGLAGAQGAASAGGRPAVVHLIAPDRLPAAWLELKRLASGRPLALTHAAEPVATGAALLGAVRAGLLRGDVGSLLAGDAPVLPARQLTEPAHDAYAPALARFVARAVAPAAAPGPPPPGGPSLATHQEDT